MKQRSESEHTPDGKPEVDLTGDGSLSPTDQQIPVDFFSGSPGNTASLLVTSNMGRSVTNRFERVAAQLNGLEERGILVYECNPISQISTEGVDVTLTLPDETISFKKTYIWESDPEVSAIMLRSLEGAHSLSLGPTEVQLDWVVTNLETGEDTVQIASRFVTIFPNEPWDSDHSAQQDEVTAK